MKSNLWPLNSGGLPDPLPSWMYQHHPKYILRVKNLKGEWIKGGHGKMTLREVSDEWVSRWF